MTHILIFCSIVIIIVSVEISKQIKRKKRQKLREKQEQELREKQEQELREKREADRQVRLATLIKQKKEEDEKLSIEKNIKCDDGITRVYKGSMYGIIRDYQEDIIVNYISQKKDEIGTNLYEELEFDDLKEKMRLLTEKLTKTFNNSEEVMILKEIKTLRTRINELRHKMYPIVKCDVNFKTKIKNVKWFSSTGKYINVDEVIELNRKYNLMNREYKERYKAILGVMKFSMRFPKHVELICINDHYFVSDAWGDPEKLFSGTIDGVTYINGIAVQNENKLASDFNNKMAENNDLSYFKSLPKSPLSFDNLDEETKKLVEGKTLFVYEDGTIDESRGTGKELVNNLRFFIENVRGIDEDEIIWSLTGEMKPENDVDGKWYFINGQYLMKCFSSEKLAIELVSLLRENQISIDSAEHTEHIVNTENNSRLIIITSFKSTHFTIDVPPKESGKKGMIVIKKNDVEQEIDKENHDIIDKSQAENESILTIFHAANHLQDENKHEDAIDHYNKIIGRLENEKENIINNQFIIDSASSADISLDIGVTPIHGVYFNLGQSYRALNKLKQAKEAFEKAIQINPDAEAMVFHHLGVTKMQLGDFTTCIEDFTNALKIDENHFDAYYMRAAAYVSDQSEHQDIDKAKKDLRVYLNHYPYDEAANRLLDFINS